MKRIGGHRCDHMFSFSHFSGDVSKWDVSDVTDMSDMFSNTNFNGDISKWDVSSVTNMNRMFWDARSFDGDIANWDVSRVIDMNFMFMRAKSFNQQLSGAAWVQSKATKDEMFKGSSGTILRVVYTSTTTLTPMTTSVNTYATTLVITLAPATILTTSVFAPQSKSELKIAVDTCLDLSQKGNCSNAPHGPIGEWDSSRVTDMSRMFTSTKFTGDVSKWDVSRVIDMSHMFTSTKFTGDVSKWDVSCVIDMSDMFANTKFNGDISKWNVSSVTKMNHIFWDATWFNGDISNWDVSRVTDMNRMFMGAISFKQELCGAVWVNSKATKSFMFESSSGSIARAVYTSASTSTTKDPLVFSPRSQSELNDAIEACLKLSHKGDCPDSQHGVIGEWDVSGVSDMKHMFSFSNFDGDISEWDMSSVTDMSHMLSSTIFNGDISKWDVSGVACMMHTFSFSNFNHEMSKFVGRVKRD